MNRGDALKLAGAGADFRQKRRGVSKLDCFDGTNHFSLDGYYSRITNRKQSQDAGFLVPHDAIVRIRKSSALAAGYVPALGNFITISEPTGAIKLRIAEFGIHGAEIEHVIGCKASLSAS